MRPRSRPRLALVVLLGALLFAPPTTAVASPPDPMPDPPVPSIAVGSFGWPLGGLDGGGPPTDGAPGSAAKRFLPPPNPYGRGHRGVDLVAARGTPVLAAGPGVVAQAGMLAGRGVVSVVHPGGLRTTYEPVTAAVVIGSPVARGTVVGTLDAGHAGCPAAACLHWGLRWRAEAGARREQYLDPLLLVGLGRTRLWPVRG
ncbi:M23 family metallopeptidase [Actinomycetospora endophytica]|uniref:M23 family metallopeptidase n=1 Tax=Actinomycetospora endophytica TaxID=2291215 RepID=A0ABS8PFU6_9PSEU|nr:M23 family metallopeptidase [Actinomycetospora endophytica]MCD2197131.1 M23 family metallopeptidase [Actinomycetospora endophytica]